MKHVILKIPAEQWSMLQGALELDTLSGVCARLADALQSVEDVTADTQKVVDMFLPDEERHYSELSPMRPDEDDAAPAEDHCPDHIVHNLRRIQP